MQRGSAKRIEGVLTSVRIAVVIAMLIYEIYILTEPLLLERGLPSYSVGVFHTATVGYYMETAKLLSVWGWWTPAWCGGFQDLIRFYPPLGIALLFWLHKLAPDLSLNIAYSIAIALLSLGVACLAYVLTRRLEVSLIAAFIPLISHAYVVTIATYWEYTRVLGDGLAFLALSLYISGLATGSRARAIYSGILAGLTLLTSLISFPWLALSMILITLEFLVAAYRGAVVREAILYPLRYLLLTLVVLVAIAGWWLVPAIAPYGLAHYSRIHTPYTFRLWVALNPMEWKSPYIPSVNPITLVLGLLVAILIFRKGVRIPLGLILVSLILIVLHPQGTRFSPYMELSLLYSLLYLLSIEWSKAYYRLIYVALLLTFVAFLFIEYSPIYYEKLRLDYSYVLSDEYTIAYMLRTNGFVYLMYGPRLHGNQWVNYFNPYLKQILSGFMEGCLNPDVYKLDWAIKYSLDDALVAKLLTKYNVTYVVVDREWYGRNRPNVIELLVKKGVLVKDPRSTYLRYSLIYRVNSSMLGISGAPKSVAKTHLGYCYWTPAKVLGLIVSVLAIAILFRLRRSI